MQARPPPLRFANILSPPSTSWLSGWGVFLPGSRGIQHCGALGRRGDENSFLELTWLPHQHAICHLAQISFGPCPNLVCACSQRNPSPSAGHSVVIFIIVQDASDSDDGAVLLLLIITATVGGLSAYQALCGALWVHFLSLIITATPTKQGYLSFIYN